VLCPCFLTGYDSVILFKPVHMRLPVLISACLSLAATLLSAKAPEFSKNRDLPPLRLAAADLDTILLKTHSLIAAANGPSGEQDSGRESVKLGVRGREIEIPHFSLASSVAFPKEIFRFSYTYYRPDKPISSVTVDLGDSSRRVSVSGEAADQVQAITNLLENDLLRHSTTIGGAIFRRVAGVCLSVAFLTSLIFSGAYWWNTRRYSALGMLVCSALGLMLVLLVPWDRYLPGFALYQRYSPFLLVRYAPQIFFFSLLATLAGIPLSYFLPRWRRKA
jgi:hypothetical protein